MRRIIMLTGFLILALMMVGCSQSSSTQSPQSPQAVKATPAAASPATPQSGGTLKIISGAEVNSLGLPVKMLSPEDTLQCRPAIETLNRFDSQGLPVPYLSESWKEDAANKTLTMVFKKGITFHDGTPFNAEAVKWNMDQFIAVKNANYQRVASVTVVDEYTVKITFSTWDNAFLGALASFSGLTVSPESFKKNGQDWAIKNPVGTGPFKLVSWQRDVNKIFEKNPNYWQKGKPYLDKIEFTIIADPTVEKAAFLKQDGDMVTNVNVKDAAELKAQNKYTISQATTGGFWRGLIPDSINTQSPSNNIKVRQAIAYAIDREAINNTVFRGLGSPTNQLTNMSFWSINPDVTGYPYNPDKAKQLLSEAGYSNGIKTSIYFRNDQIFVDLYTAAQGYLRKVGIDAQLQALDPSKYVAIMMQQGWPEGMLGTDGSDAPDMKSNFNYFLKNSVQGMSKMVLRPDELSDLAEFALAAPDFNAKKNAYWQIEKMVIDKYCMVIPINAIGSLVVKYPKVHDDGLSSPHVSSWTPENAWVSK
jgi:peptide/nickel transport system substrate-binding protein